MNARNCGQRGKIKSSGDCALTTHTSTRFSQRMTQNNYTLRALFLSHAYLTQKHPAENTSEGGGKKKTVLHWGQRKLLFSEIEFLTLHVPPSGATVVYAGAAPGTHVSYLCALFPSVHFVLVDPEDFTVREGPQVTIRQELFTDSLAADYTETENVLFISDIRTANPSKMNGKEVEVCVKRDQKWQSDWHKIMKPVASMFKFRLPWEDGLTTYLDGVVCLPVFGPQTTSETRLIVAGMEEKE